MTVQNSHDIEKMAAAAIRVFGDDTLPIKVEQIAGHFDISVKYAPLGDELSGMAFVKEGKNYIVVNSEHHLNRKRFTIAHEFGHHVLHKNIFLDNIHVDKAVLKRNIKSSEGLDKIEIEANAFAAAILMPLNAIRNYRNIDINDDIKTGAIARAFGVSQSALIFRIINIRSKTSA